MRDKLSDFLQKGSDTASQMNQNFFPNTKPQSSITVGHVTTQSTLSGTNSAAQVSTNQTPSKPSDPVSHYQLKPPSSIMSIQQDAFAS